MRMSAMTRPQTLAVAAGISIVVIGLMVWVGWYKLFRKEPAMSLSMEEQFKYGSIGTEDQNGIPFWIWLVLPGMFPEYLPGPGGYPSLGIVWEEGHEMPIGFTKRTIGFPRVGINCALCHTAAFRVRGNEKPTIIPGGPAHQ